MAKFGLEAPLGERHAAKGGIGREELEGMVEEGMSIAQMALRLGRSKTTVRHWLGKFGLETKAAGRRRATKKARETNQRVAELTCEHHGATAFLLEGRGNFRCLRCRSEAVSRRRRRIKQVLVEEAGGGCAICGYDRSVAALHFHHLDPATKSFAVGLDGVARSLERAREEMRKCVLLCSNCHAEVEAGLVKVPSNRPA